jgi:TonB family protein
MHNSLFRKCLPLLLVGAVVATSLPAAAQDRKLKSKAPVVYPELAKHMHISGTVKIEVTVDPSGSVSKVKALGGHPLLIESATDAASKCKFETASTETTQILEFNFTPTN